MRNILVKLADWIYKKKCYFCSKSYENTKMCSNCYEQIEFLSPTVNRIILNSNVYCACEYTNIIQKLIRGVKYHRQAELARYQAEIMYEYWKKLNIQKKFCIIPVPISKERQKSRKYNHMELVAKEFANLSGFDINTNLIERIKNTKPQYKLTKKERMKNLENAFKINKNEYNNMPLLIIDDICTTGATFENIIMELNKFGINDITCFTTATPRI
jgi:ComF family protein